MTCKNNSFWEEIEKPLLESLCSKIEILFSDKEKFKKWYEYTFCSKDILKDPKKRKERKERIDHLEKETGKQTEICTIMFYYLSELRRFQHAKCKNCNDNCEFRQT